MFHDIEGARDIIIDGLGPLQPTVAEVGMFFRMFEDELEFYREANPPRRDPPKSELHVLSQDSQNVHTEHVNKQTESGVELLLNTSIPVGQDTLKEIGDIWTGKKSLVLKDMKRWYAIKTCRTKHDYLYQRTLDGLWARIKISSEKDELLERLWEECYESVSMCCEGHISRLCNVLVGFDESFKAPVSIGELLQQKMSVIAGEDIDVLKKVEKAWYVMEELAIPREQREAWIEAF
jgi:hypothetical protein